MGSRAERPRAPAAAALPWLNLVAVVAIVALDWMTAAGVVVGILLCIPIILTSMHDDGRQTWVAAGVALAGFLLAAGYGRGPMSPESVWLPNRVFAFLTIPAGAYLAHLLRRRRLEAEAARDEALAAGELNRLLMSLLAHDLRTPLTLAVQGLDYVAAVTARGEPVDPALVGDLRARLERNLRAVEGVLAVAREGSGAARPQVPLSRLAREIAAEVDSFAGEARHNGKRVVARLAALDDDPGPRRVDGLVLRQSLAILLDNAIRHARPGEVRVEAARDGETLVLRVADEGPGLSAAPADRGGSGLGLELARTLAHRAGGRLEVERDSPAGTEFALRLPLQPPA